MKSIVKNKFVVIVIIIVIAAVTGGGFLLLHQKSLSPKETVELYFEYFNDKNVKGMQSLVVDNLKGIDGTQGLEYVHLVSCYEELDESKNDSKFVKAYWYPEAKYIKKYHVVIDIKYEEGVSKSGFDQGQNYMGVNLAKKSENDPWIIVSYGN